MSTPSSISEKSKVSISIASFWSLIVSVISMTIWITILITNLRYRLEQLYVENQREHSLLISNYQSVEKDYVKKYNLEHLLVSLDRRMFPSNSLPDEMELRRIIQNTLK